MENYTFDMRTMHCAGPAYYEYLGLRKRFFVDKLGWDIPHNADVEMDQYDNPTARYSVVCKNGQVVGGARAQPTTATWGQHTYMLRDALQGQLADIPAWVMPSDVATPTVWECTRLVISDDLTTHADRNEALSLIVGGLVEMAEEEGADQMICLSSVLLMRALRKLGYDCTQLGPIYKGPQDGRSYAVLTMPTGRKQPKVHHLPERRRPLLPSLQEMPAA